MTPDRSAKVDDLLSRALRLDAGARRAFLVRECGNDAELLAEVASRLGEAAALANLASRTVVVDTTDTVDAEEADESMAGLTTCPVCGRHYDGEVVCPHDGGRLVEDPAGLVGAAFDELYEVDSFLGKGAMGLVYRARHALLKDVVALKLMPRDVGGRPESLRRFLREGQAARRFRHPNAVAVYDLRMARDGTAYLVMEYVPGRTLRAELKRRGRLSLAEALAIVEPIASALDAAHAAGVVHRDLKPENVMIVDGEGGEPVVKVLDLGIAKIYESGIDGDATVAGFVVGTPLYMPPEQWGAPPRDGNPRIDGRADLYSLAVLTFELLAGSRPLRGSSVDEVRMQHLYEAPQAIRDVVAGLPAAAERAIARALSKDRADRQRSAGEFARQLRDALDAGGRDEAGHADYPATIVDAPSRATMDALPEATDVGGAAARLRRVPNNVPWPITAFVGRARELGECEELLRRARLLTLAGPGGVGKTRLALETAARAGAESPDGVWFVELDALGEPELVAGAVASALGIKEERGRDALSSIRERLGDGRALLVLDNCERVIDAAAAVAGALLRSCPSLRVLATSREPLGVAGEAIFRVPSLTLPADGPGEPLEAAAASEAARLFVERARLGSPGFALKAENAAAVAELCRRLDGVPLAVELAAACTRMFTLDQILARLDAHFDLPSGASRGVPERQRTLRGAIDWGYEMLAKDERALLGRLAVFSGGWDLEAAEAVVGEEGSGIGDQASGSEGSPPIPDPRSPIPQTVLAILIRLVDKSFVVAEPRGGEERYRMLETIRRYAAEKLGESGEEDRLVARHRAWYLGLAARAEGQLNGPAAGPWLAKLAAEHDNFRAVLQRSFERAEAPGAALRLCTLLERFWDLRGNWSEGRRWFERALEAAPAAPAALRASALNGAGNLAILEGDFARAVAIYEESLALRRAAGDGRKVANSLHNLAIAMRESGDVARAEELYAESHAIYRELGDRQGIAVALNSLGALAAARGDDERAAALFAECLASFRELGDWRRVGFMLANLGEIAYRRRDFEAARAFFEESLAVANDLGFKILAANAVEFLGGIALERGDLSLSRSLLADALAARRDLGNWVGIAGALERLACAAAASGDAERAVRIAAGAAEIRRSNGSSLSATERDTLERYLAPARAALGDEGASRALRWAAEADAGSTVSYALKTSSD